MNAIFKPYLT